MSVYAYRIEDKFLIQYSRENGLSNTELRFDEQAIDWSYLVDLASKNRVILPIYHHLKQHPLTLPIPDPTLSKLRQYSLKQIQQNLLLKGELIRLLHQFNSASIQVMPLKGPLLTEQLYGDLALRESSDLDLLIPIEALPIAQNILQDLGYTPCEPLDMAMARSYHMTFNNPVKQIRVEIHWQLARPQYPCYRKAEILWESSQVSDYVGTKVWVPTSEHLLVYLAIHAFRHFWWQLRWVQDMALLIQSTPDINWDYVSEYAHRWHADKILVLSARILNEIGEPNLPIKFKENVPTYAVNQALKNIFSISKTYRSVENFWRIAMPLVGNHYDQLRFLVDVAPTWIEKRARPTERDYYLVKLPRRLHFLYYFIRLVRLPMHAMAQLIQWRFRRLSL